MKWWLDTPMRMVQTNLREIDVRMDREAFVRSLKEFSANVVLFSMGGIVANYETRLDCQYKNPYIDGDFARDMIERVHAQDIRFIARFDFSKVNEVIGNHHTDWLYRGVSGQHVNYNGQLHTCVNGHYQQECSLQILEEVLDGYPVDGVFFNLFGYNTDDYHGRDYGICQCENCARRFYEETGEALPTKVDGSSALYMRYVRFCRETSRALQSRITGLVKDRRSDVAVCNYRGDGVDIFRHEAYTSLDERLPEWNFAASQNNKEVYASWQDKVSSSAAVHFVDLPFRHAAVSPHLTYARLAQDMANCGWLDYYVIGTLLNQDDRLCLEGVRGLYDFHRRNERYFTGMQSLADVCLVYPASGYTYAALREFRGIYRMLVQAHVLFDVIYDSVLDTDPQRLDKYGAVILPDTRCMTDGAVEAVDAYVRGGGRLLATGAASSCGADGENLGRIRLACTGAGAIRETHGREKGAYFRVRAQDKASLTGFDKLDILYLYSEFFHCDAEAGAHKLLGHIPPCMFGPPEKCYYTSVTENPGVIWRTLGEGRGAIIPWQIGTQYENHSHHGHAALLTAVLHDVLQCPQRLSTDASALVEVTAHNGPSHSIVSLVNLSGQLGTAFLGPVPMRDIHVAVWVQAEPVRVTALRAGEALRFHRAQDGTLTLIVPLLDAYEVILIENSVV